MTPAQNLAAARDLIISRGWTQEAYARDENGCETDISSDHAVCFCARGALFRVMDIDAWHGDDLQELIALKRISRMWWNEADETGVNDEAQSVAEVITMFDLAIQELTP